MAGTCPGYSVTVRVEAPATIGCDRGPCGCGVEMLAERSPHWTSWSRSRPGIVVDVTCNASGADHADRVSDSICEVAGNHDRQGQRPDVAASSSMEHPGSRSHQGRHEGGCRRHRGNESATERPTCFRWAGWESVEAAWRLHARLFPAVAGKGDLSRVGTCTPRNLPTRCAAGFLYLDGLACAVARLGAYAHRTASGYLDEPATGG